MYIRFHSNDHIPWGYELCFAWSVVIQNCAISFNIPSIWSLVSIDVKYITALAGHVAACVIDSPKKLPRTGLFHFPFSRCTRIRFPESPGVSEHQKIIKSIYSAFFLRFQHYQIIGHLLNITLYLVYIYNCWIHFTNMVELILRHT